MAMVLMMLIAMAMRMSGDVVGNRGDDDDGEADCHNVGDDDGDADGVDAAGKRDGDDGGDHGN